MKELIGILKLLIEKSYQRGHSKQITGGINPLIVFAVVGLLAFALYLMYRLADHAVK